MEKPKRDQYYYNSEEYAERLQEIEIQKAQIRQEKEEEAKEKKREISKEKKRLQKIFTNERCGVENAHFVASLIDRAAFLRVELEHIEHDLRVEGVMDFFTQGTQVMWREHPLSRVHVQYSKNYRDVIAKLEAYGKESTRGSGAEENPVGSLIGKVQTARSKYQQ